MRALTVAVSLAMALSAAAATGLHGQAVAGEAQSAFCWRGQPLPACRSFALFELEGALAVASTTEVHESSTLTARYPVFENALTWNLGAMRNLSQAWGLGATVSLGTGSPSPFTGIRVRARRWLGARMSVELEAGAVNTGINDGFGSGSGWGPTLGARLNLGDYASVFTRWEGVYAQAGSTSYFYREAGFHQGLYVGASAGSTVAVAGTAVLGGFALLVVHMLGDF